MLYLIKEESIKMLHKIRLHHFDPWYELIHNRKKYENDMRLLLLANEIEIRSGKESRTAYFTFQEKEAPSLFCSFSLDDYILVVQNKDSICSKCPKTLDKFCSRFDKHDDLTKSMGLKVGKRYKVEDIFKKFVEYKSCESFPHVYSGKTD